MTVNPSRLDQPRAFLRALFDAALRAADPARALPPRLPPPPRGRTVVVGAGKAAAAMAKAVEQHWRGPLSGLVITRYGHAVACPRIEVVEASHPVPDAAGGAAAARILEKVRGLTADDLVLVLASGGGSALMALPAPGLALDDKRTVTRGLLRSGATIGEINCVRKHLSAIKGGRLAAAAAPAHVVTLAISDVPGDDPAIIASGPTVPDPSTFAQARAILARSEVVLIATPQDALAAAAAAARAAGVTPLVLGDAIEGEARDVALVHAGIARQTAAGRLLVGDTALPRPAVLLSGGETTVTVRGSGRGGRNAEFLLALAVALDRHPAIHALAADTDGVDGTEDNAGAFYAPDTLPRAEALGLDLRARLADNDGYGAFHALGDLLVTGPTLTNVNDFRAILVLPPGDRPRA